MSGCAELAENGGGLATETGVNIPRPRTDSEMEEVERRRWEHLVQEAWLRRGRRLPLSEVEPPAGGLSAEVAVVPAVTAAVVVSINIDPALWGEEGDGENQEDGSIEALAAPYVFGWRSLGLLPGDSFNILGELGKQLERRYQALSKRSLMVSHCHNSGVAQLGRSLFMGREHAGKCGRVIFHYGGYGVARPESGSLYLIEPTGSGVRCEVRLLYERACLPLVVVADCANANDLLLAFLHSDQAAKRKMGVGSSDSAEAGGCAAEIPRAGALDASSRGTTDSVLNDFFFLGATRTGELPQHPKLPSDILTSCLMTPLQIALLWFLVENDSVTDIHPLLPFLIPGALDDKKTPLGQLQWAAMTIMECIAWSSLPYRTFVRLFREDVVLAPLFRGFLLAERIITALGGEVCAYPPLPRMGSHPMWDSLDCIIGRTFVSLKRAVQPSPPTSLTTMEFREWLDWNLTKWRCEQHSMSLPSLGGRPVVVPDFLEEEFRCLMAVSEQVTEQSLLCYEGIAWQQCRRPEHIGAPWAGKQGINGCKGAAADSAVGSASVSSDPSVSEGGRGCSGGAFTKPFPSVARLPMLLQGLLVVAHRDEAMKILCRFLDSGYCAVEACAKVGIFDMALARFWTRGDLKYLLPAILFVYAKACYADPSMAGAGWAQRSAVSEGCLEVLESPVSSPSDIPAEPGWWQREELGYWSGTEGQRVLASAVLAMISFSFAEEKGRLLQSRALNVCGDLLQHAAARTTLLLHKSSDVESIELEGHHQHWCTGIADTGSSRLTAYVLSLIALLVSLSWETKSAAELGGAGIHEAQVQDSCGETKVQRPLTLERLRTSLEALRVLTWASSSLVRGAALKAVVTIMSSELVDEASSLHCIHIIVGCADVLATPREGNMVNRTELVDHVFLSIRWLVRHLSARMSMEALRVSVQRVSEKIYRVTTAEEDDLTASDEEGRASPGCRTSDPSVCRAYFAGGCSVAGCPSNRDGRFVAGAGCLVVELARLMCWTAVAASDPCPYVSARAREALNCLPPLAGGGFFAPLEDLRVSGSAEGLSRGTRRLRLRDFFLLLSRLKLPNLKGGLRMTASRGGGSVSRRNTIGGAREGKAVGANCGPADAQTPTHDTVMPRRIVSAGGDAAVQSFVFTLLAFLGELLLVPVDDDDPRHNFNLKRNSCTREHMRRVREGLRPPAPQFGPCSSGSGFDAVLSPVPLGVSPLMPHVDSVKWAVDDERGLINIVSPITSQPPITNLSMTSDTSLGASSRSRPDSSISFEYAGNIDVMAFHASEGHLVAGGSNGVVQVWSWGTEEPLYAYSCRSSPAPSAASSLSATAASIFTSIAATAGVTCAPGRVRTNLRFLSGFCTSGVRSWADPVAFARSSTLFNHHCRQQHFLGQEGGRVSTADSHPSSGQVGRLWSARLPPTTAEEGTFSMSEHCSGVSSETFTGLHFVDASYRTLLCVVGSSGSVQLFMDYSGGSAVKRVASFSTLANKEGRVGGGACSSSYHVPAALLHVAGLKGSIDSWDLACEHKVSEGLGRGELPRQPCIVASSCTDASIVAVGARSLYLFDLRCSTRSIRVFPGVTEATGGIANCTTRGGSELQTSCLHVSFPHRYPHLIAAGYGGSRGVLTLWDERYSRSPLRCAVVADPTGVGALAGQSPVCRMVVQPYLESLTTVSVTADAVFISDAMGETATSGPARPPYARLKEPTSAVAVHPVLPLSAVAGAGSLRIYRHSSTSSYY